MTRRRPLSSLRPHFPPSGRNVGAPRLRGIVSPVAENEFHHRASTRAGAPTSQLTLLLVDSHSIYRRGLAACTAALPEVERVYEAASVTEVAGHSSIGTIDVALVDQSLPGALELVRALGAGGRTRVLVCCAGAGER